MNHDFFEPLSRAGLNLQAVFNLSDLPADIAGSVAATGNFRQLILIGHGGGLIWSAVMASRFKKSTDPIDMFSIDHVKQWFALHAPEVSFEMIYPFSQQPVALQKLGELAGWHHPSPFRIGINQPWGSWFAYRVAVLADSCFEPTQRFCSASPCDACVDKPCIAACPASAMADGDLSLNECVAYRLKSGSACKHQCLSRLACPVGVEHRYSSEQINYHYERSMWSIREHYR